jgi:hypothetical protein
MIKKLGISVVLCAAVLLTACGTMRNIQKGSALEVDDNSAVMVLGVTPRIRIHLLRGAIEGDYWVMPNFDVPEVNLFPEDGYIVVRSKPTTTTERFGVSSVFPGGGAYGPCRDSLGPTFVLRGGAVNYLGELRYSFDGAVVRHEHSVDEAKVRSFLNANYPGYSERLVIYPVTKMKVKSNRRCYQAKTSTTAPTPPAKQ